MTKKRKSEPAKGKPRKARGEPEEAPAEPKVHRRPFDWWRENIEALVIAVILAVVIRHFAVEAFEIPTGSMAETLYGMHARLQCPNCSTGYNVALRSDSSTGRITTPYDTFLIYDGPCGNPHCGCELHAQGQGGFPLRAAGDLVECGACRKTFRGGEEGKYRRAEALLRDTRCPVCHHRERRAVIEKQNQHGGHKILVTKFAYAIGKPRRWDVIVFEFDQWKNYIKRLVGLPGERIDVWDGDLYVNGKIERKSKVPHIQNALWTLISDSDLAERGLNSTAAWGEVAPAESGRRPGTPMTAEWYHDDKRWSMNAVEDFTMLQYQRGFDNYYSYNLLLPNPLSGHPPGIQVGDKKVAFTAKVTARGPQREGRVPSWVGAEIRDGDFTFRLTLPVGKPSEEKPATLVRLENDSGLAPRVTRKEHEGFARATAAVSIPVGTPVRVEFENVDDRVVTRLDGEEVLVIEYTSLPMPTLPEKIRDRPAQPSEMIQKHCIYLLAANIQVELRSIQVYRDMYYIATAGRLPWTRGGIDLGPQEYFAMGDNAPSSSDGRYWGAIPAENLMGKAFVVFWPLLSMSKGFQGKFIR